MARSWCVAFVLTYQVAPDGPVREIWYAAVGGMCVAWAYVGLRRHSPARPLPWIHLLAGFGACDPLGRRQVPGSAPR